MMADTPTEPAMPSRIRASLRPFSAFLDWWVYELRGLLRSIAGRLRPWPPTEQRLRMADYRTEVRRCRGAEVLGPPASRWPPRWLRRVVGPRAVGLLPPDQVLRRRVRLPGAARGNLRQVLGYEMDRLTPFTAPEVVFDHRLVGDSGHTLEIELRVAPKAAAEALVGAAREQGLQLRHLDVGIGERGRAPGWQRAGFDLLPREEAPQGGHGHRALQVALVTFAAAVSLAALALPVWTDTRAVARLEAALEETRGQAAEAHAARTRFERTREELLAVLERHAEGASGLRLLAALSGAIPDHTWVHRLELDGRSLTLHGHSAEAAGLIAQLDGLAALHGVGLDAPVTRSAGRAEQRFQLSATVERGGPSHAVASR